MVHQGSNSSRYRREMNGKQTTADILVDNLKSLMRSTKTTRPALAKKSKVSSRMIAYILSKERVPTVETIEALSSAFGLKSWQLLVPGISPGIANKADALINKYSVMTDSGREYLDRVAEQEIKYKSSR